MYATTLHVYNTTGRPVSNELLVIANNKMMAARHHPNTWFVYRQRGTQFNYTFTPTHTTLVITPPGQRVDQHATKKIEQTLRPMEYKP